MKFLGYTIGLECNGHGRVGVLTKIEIHEDGDELIRLQPVSGRNLAPMPGEKLISRAKYDQLPRDPLNDAKRAIALMELCGFTPMALDR